MHRRRFASARFVAVLATAFVVAPSTARADLVIPTDFSVTQAYALSRCEPFALTDPSDFTVTVWITACVSGSIDFGLNTDTGLYGAAYDFTTTITGTPPGSWVVGARMCDFAFDGYWPDTGAHTYITVGGLAPCPTPLTNGVAYSPVWYSGSRIVETSAYFAAFIPYPNPFGSDDRWGWVGITTVPEPSSLVLLGSGLILLVGLSRARGIRDGSHSGDR